IMSFDECIPYPADRAYVEASIARTTRWERQTLDHHPRDGRALFGIVQGGVYPDLRLRSARELLELDFDGMAMGGLFVGEERDTAMELLGIVGEEIPQDRARYVMGVGTPIEILDCVAAGWDMFDCVLPSRNARHGTAMTFEGPVRLKNASHRSAAAPLEEGCDCLACTSYSRAYLRHLLVAKELVASTLITHHNLRFMQRLMTRARQAIEAGTFQAFRDETAQRYGFEG
ncbi:MAG: tRNA-guanine transglycosylase, partial [Planctomycetes bacterium]|nr:tRNA-guanine transglycosylase [Planctomycetota bacterium]